MENKRQLLLHLKKFFLFMLVSFVSVNLWRGTWGLLDEYLFPSDYRLSIVISLFVGVLLLLFVPEIIDELK
jgi:ABC-type siderophore export system fused ATPase/permease subunit